MALLTNILLLLCLKYTLAEYCVIDNTPDYITWEKELLEDLKCGYSPHQAPSGNTIVNITYILEMFTYDDVLDRMNLQTWVATNWKDERLKWDPEKHHGIEESDITNFRIWTPISERVLSWDVELCGLKSTGEVLYQYRKIQKALCIMKLTNWPYDVQECSFKFVPTSSSRQTGNYTINFNLFVLAPNSSEWYIYDYKHVQDNSTKGPFKLTFYLMREAVGLSAIVIWPAFVLTVLSILSLCLDVRRKVRLAIICLSLLGHYYFLTELIYNIPRESQFPPTLLLYYRGSVVLSIITVLATLFLAAMCKSKSTPHNYVKLINDFMYENNRRTYLVFPRWDFDDATVDSKSSSEDWLKFANIVNSVIIFCIVFAYIGLCGTNIPKRILI